MAGVTLSVLFKIPIEGVSAFQNYEAAVLPLVASHCGTLERRLRNGDGTVEHHVLSFPSRAAYDAFRADPRRAMMAPQFAASGATAELHELDDVRPDT